MDVTGWRGSGHYPLVLLSLAGIMTLSFPEKCSDSSDSVISSPILATYRSRVAIVSAIIEVVDVWVNDGCSRSW